MNWKISTGKFMKWKLIMIMYINAHLFLMKIFAEIMNFVYNNQRMNWLNWKEKLIEKFLQIKLDREKMDNGEDKLRILNIGLMEQQELKET